MVRRTVNEAELVDVADTMHRFVTDMDSELEQVANGLESLQETWGGMAFDAFIGTVAEWQQWAKEMGEKVGTMRRNAHIAYHNYMEVARINSEMWD